MAGIPADPITVPRGHAHARTIPLDPPDGTPDPVAYHAATMAETAAMLVLVRGSTSGCGPDARCPTRPCTPICVPCAVDVAHIYIRAHHQPTATVDDMAESAAHVHAAVLRDRLDQVDDRAGTFVSVPLLDIARAFAGAAVG